MILYRHLVWLGAKNSKIHEKPSQALGGEPSTRESRQVNRYLLWKGISTALIKALTNAWGSSRQDSDDSACRPGAHCTKWRCVAGCEAGMNVSGGESTPGKVPGTAPYLTLSGMVSGSKSQGECVFKGWRGWKRRLGR